MQKNSKIFVTGATGMVGSAIVRSLRLRGFDNLITDRIDLRDQTDVNDFFWENKPEYVFLVAGKVGGIKANNEKKAEFIYDNLMIAANVIDAARNNNVIKLLYAASSCAYPRNSPQPILEEYLLTGELEKTNEPYAIAKIAGIKLCQSYNAQYGCNFISTMPTNSYGDGDNYDLNNSHVIPALIRKIIEAKESGTPTVEIWGTGNALREFLYVDDMADAMIYLMNCYNSPEVINIGTGDEITIRAVAEMIAKIVGYEGQLSFNGALDGTPRKLLSTSKLSNLDWVGWFAETTLEDGLKKTIANLDRAKWK